VLLLLGRKAAPVKAEVSVLQEVAALLVADLLAT
jgi:hypothetical protein